MTNPTPLALFGVHFALAIALFFVMNWIGRHSIPFGYMQLSMFVRADEAPAFNFVFRVLTPVVYLLLVSAALYSLKLDLFTEDIYLVVAYYLIFRLAFNVIAGRSRLLNWPLQFVHIILSFTLSWIAYQHVIIEKSHFLPDLATISNELWIIIIGFIYVLFNQVRLTRAATEKRKQTYLRHRYQLYKRKYGDIVARKAPSRKVEALIYAVMIYEAFNRPKLYRLLEAILFRFGLSKTLGVMQVTTQRHVSDEESVETGSELISGAYSAAMQSPEDPVTKWMSAASMDPDMLSRLEEHRAIRETLLKYNKSGQYASEVETLYELIRREFYPNGDPSAPKPSREGVDSGAASL